MAKYPSEIFGFYLRNVSPDADDSRKKYWCPFHGSPCYKQSRLLDFPFGVCTAHVEGQEIALCPRRFLENNKVFQAIAISQFGTSENVLVFSEVGLPGIGNFDFVMVKHKPFSAQIEDFVAVEFQTGQTTSTGQLVKGFKDFMADSNLPDNASYRFGINMYDIWKRTFTQILNKGIIMEKWEKKIFWVIQDPVFNYFQQKFRLSDMGYNESNCTVFSLYDLKISDNRLDLIPTRMFSSTVDALFDAFRRNDEIPPVEKFVERLESKLSGDIKIALHLGHKKAPSKFDAPKPGSTGRVRESLDEYEINPKSSGSA
ncbi:MAG: NotI family restriction endonuclease [Smithella sp.]